MKTRRLSAGIFDSLITSIENFHYWFSRKVRHNVQDYFEIETTQAEKEDVSDSKSYSIVAKDGSLLTVFEFDGIRTIMDKKALHDKLVQLDKSGIATTMREAGHTLEIFFTMSPEGGEDLIRNLTSMNRETVKKFELNFDDVMDSKISHLPKFIHQEKCYLGIWTHPTSINAIELEAAIANKMEELRNSSLPRYRIKDRNAQYPYGGLDLLMNNHESLVKNIFDELNKILGFKVKKITAHEALAIVKKTIYGNEVPENWRPIIVGDELPVSLREQKADKKGYDLLLDSADLVYPPLSMQILDSDIYVPKEELKQVVVGNRIFSSVTIEIPPKATPFNDLLVKLVNAKVPFNMRTVIKSDGMAYKGLKGWVANALNFAGENNRRIADSIKWLNVIAEKEVVLRYSMTFSTYAPIGEDRLLRSRVSQLKHIISSWGQCQPKDSFGDPVTAFFDTIPFISPNNSSEINYHLAPMYSLFKMLPLFRPASVFENGACLYRSEDGKLIPFEICSPKQTTWAYYIMAIPGSGKSVDLAVKIIGAITQAGLERLPYISSLDIGRSQSYLISMIQSAYPQYLKHLAISERLTMEKRHAINMFDLHLGCETPDENHRGMLINFLCELLTPPSAKSIDENFPSLITAVVDRAYKKVSLLDRDGQPKLYTPNTDAQVDEAIRKHRISVLNGRTSWYQIRNDLFDLGDVYNAERAQRYGVPLISDLMEAVKDTDIKNTYGTIYATDGSNERLIDKFVRLIGIAQTNYPNLFLPTVLDVSAARIVSLDLDLVTKGEGDTGRKQQAIMYMVGKYAITKNFRLDEEIVKTFPDRYQQYHLERVREMLITNKILCVDEYHRTKNSQYIQNDFVRDAREGRKWKLSIILSSQQGDDIGEELREFLTGIFILRANGEENAKKLQERFGFGDAERYALLEKCHGPTEKGAPFLAILQTEEGTTTQLLYSSISPVEMWALTTTAEDVRIRKLVSDELGEVEARARLARAYNFTAKYAIQDLRNENLRERNDETLDPIKLIVRRILESSPVYSNREGAIFDAPQEVSKYYAEQDEERRQARIKQMEQERIRRSEEEQMLLNEQMRSR